MKSFISIIVFGLLLATSCTGVRSTSKGLDNVAYLEFIGSPEKYSGGIIVTIDDLPPFTARVYSANTERMRGKVYSITTGQHQLKVTFLGREVYNRQIFVGAQETKQINLP